MMKVVLAMLDNVAETLEQRGEVVLATTVDIEAERIDRSTQKTSDRVTAVLDEVADAAEQRGDTTLASAADQASESFVVESFSSSPDIALGVAAPKIIKAVEQYGAHGYVVRGSVVDIRIRRGDVETTASLGFASRDDAGQPRLRLAFRCGDDQMVRWATLPRVDDESIVRAVRHVFETGENAE